MADPGAQAAARANAHGVAPLPVLERILARLPATPLPAVVAPVIPADPGGDPGGARAARLGTAPGAAGRRYPAVPEASATGRFHGRQGPRSSETARPGQGRSARRRPWWRIRSTGRPNSE